LHMAQLMPLPLTVSCFSKIQIGLPFWYRLTRVVPEKGPLNRCVWMPVWNHWRKLNTKRQVLKRLSKFSHNFCDTFAKFKCSHHCTHTGMHSARTCTRTHTHTFNGPLSGTTWTCLSPSWCHCHSLSLAPVKSRLVLPFWYRLTRGDPDKGPLKVCVCVTQVLAGAVPHHTGIDCAIDLLSIT